MSKLLLEIAAHSQHLERDTFTAEIVGMRPEVGASEDAEQLPLLLVFASEHPRGHADLIWPSIFTETQYVMHLTKAKNVLWTCHALRTRPLAMSKKEVVERKLLEIDNLKEMDLALLAQRRAMALFRKTTGLRQPSGRIGRGRGSGEVAACCRRCAVHSRADGTASGVGCRPRSCGRD